MALIDISRSVSPDTAVWPGNQEVEWTWTSRLKQENTSVNLGSIALSTHVGTHVDAPYHVDEEGGTVDDLSLSTFVGQAQVVDVVDAPSIRPDHAETVTAERVLFKTKASFLPDDEWPESITPIVPETIRRLKQKEVLLVGTDAPSVDPLDSSELPAHQALVETGIINLEGLCLEEVSPGSYLLMATPLKIPDADAAPVRAVLSDGNE